MAYNPAEHISISASIGISNAAPTDARSMFYDNVNHKYRDYQSAEEVFAYLNLPKYRTGHFPIYIHDGGTLVNGVWNGGQTWEFWFKDTVDDDGLMSRVAFPTTTILPSGSNIIWNVPTYGYATQLVLEEDATLTVVTQDATRGTILVTQGVGGNHTLTLDGRVPSTFKPLSINEGEQDLINFTKIGGIVFWSHLDLY